MSFMPKLFGRNLFSVILNFFNPFMPGFGDIFICVRLWSQRVKKKNITCIASRNIWQLCSQLVILHVLNSAELLSFKLFSKEKVGPVITCQ